MAEKTDKLVPLTVRFTGPAIETIKSIAAEHGFSAAEIIRFTMDNKLKEYLGSIQFMDYEQGKDIYVFIQKYYSFCIYCFNGFNVITSLWNQC